MAAKDSLRHRYQPQHPVGKHDCGLAGGHTPKGPNYVLWESCFKFAQRSSILAPPPSYEECVSREQTAAGDLLLPV